MGVADEGLRVRTGLVFRSRAVGEYGAAAACFDTKGIKPRRVKGRVCEDLVERNTEKLHFHQREWEKCAHEKVTGRGQFLHSERAT